MFRNFFLFFCFSLLGLTDANLVGDREGKGEHYNITYNVTWNNTYSDQVGIILQTYINDTWTSPKKNGYDYLSIILDSEPPFFVWDIPDSFVNDFGWNGNKINIIDLSSGDILKQHIITEESFIMSSGESEADNELSTTGTIFTVRGRTTTLDTPVFETEDEKNGKREICIKEACIATYGFVIIIVVVLILLCICCKCFC